MVVRVPLPARPVSGMLVAMLLRLTNQTSRAVLWNQDDYWNKKVAR